MHPKKKAGHRTVPPYISDGRRCGRYEIALGYPQIEYDLSGGLIERLSLIWPLIGVSAHWQRISHRSDLLAYSIFRKVSGGVMRRERTGLTNLINERAENHAVALAIISFIDTELSATSSGETFAPAASSRFAVRNSGGAFTASTEMSAPSRK